MQHTVTSNIYESGTVVSERHGRIASLTRVFRVSGLNSATLRNQVESPTTSLSDREGTDRVLITGTEVTDVPVVGESHPDLPALVCMTRSIKPVQGMSLGSDGVTASMDQCVIECHYERIAVGLSDQELTLMDVNWNFSLVHETVSQDIYGQDIQVRGPDTTELNSSLGAIQTPTVTALRPMPVASFRCVRLIDPDGTSDFSHGTNIAHYVNHRLGAINNNNFLFLSPGQWMCTGLTTQVLGHIVKEGVRTNIVQYACDFTFEYRPDTPDHQGWLKTYIYATDPSQPGKRMTGINPEQHSHTPDNQSSAKDINHIAAVELHFQHDFTAEFPGLEGSPPAQEST